MIGNQSPSALSPYASRKSRKGSRLSTIQSMHRPSLQQQIHRIRNSRHRGSRNDDSISEDEEDEKVAMEDRSTNLSSSLENQLVIPENLKEEPQLIEVSNEHNETDV